MIVQSGACALRNAAQSKLCCRFAAAVSANRTHFCVRGARRSAAARRHHKNNRVALLTEVELQVAATDPLVTDAVGCASPWSPFDTPDGVRPQCGEQGEWEGRHGEMRGDDAVASRQLRVVRSHLETTRGEARRGTRGECAHERI